MKKLLRKIVSDTHPLRLLYHRMMGFLAALINLFPGNKMVMIGITGTNGKSTTVNLVTSILNATGQKVGMTSTINFQIDDKKWSNISKQTTLGPFQLQKLLRQMVKAECKYAVVEVTSHAMTQSRVYGINFDVGLVTNVTADHVEYHGSFNNYLNAKGKLFKVVSKGRRKFGIPKVLIMNADDKYYDFFNQFVADRKLTYGLKAATIYAEKIEKNPRGSKFVLHVPNSAIDIDLKMPGEFNVSNALAAASIALALQVPMETIKKGLEDSSSISGRFEQVEVGQNFSVIVDYAHTPDALESLLKLYKSLTKGRLFAVFGATGGGRDKGKRPEMGRVANEHADFIILTDDDPYEEDEWGIVEQIAEGIPRKEGSSLWKIPDRREAIRLALLLAKEDDTVVVSGKGSEEVIMLRGKRIPWNDRKVIEELLEREVEIAI